MKGWLLLLLLLLFCLAMIGLEIWLKVAILRWALAHT